MPRYIRHITLTTGHSRASYRAEIDDRAVEFFRRWLDDPSGLDLPLPPNPDLYWLSGARASKCLHAAVRQGNTLLVSIGIAAHSRCGAVLWRRMHQGATGLATDAADCPAEPWIAVRVEPGLAIYPEAAGWLGDMERVLAWAWVEHCERAP